MKTAHTLTERIFLAVLISVIGLGTVGVYAGLGWMFWVAFIRG